MDTTGEFADSTPKNIVDTLVLTVGGRFSIQSVGSNPTQYAEVTGDPPDDQHWHTLGIREGIEYTVAANVGLWIRCPIPNGYLSHVTVSDA